MSAPNFRSPEFLVDHMRRIMDFYFPICINEADGGYYNEYRDDGRITDRKTQHLVSTTRFIVNFSLGAALFGRSDYRRAAAHGLDYLQTAHYDGDKDGYFWVMDGRNPRDDSKQCYGHAFVLFAYASAAKAGLPGMAEKITQTWDLLEERFWLPRDRLYAEEFSRGWKPVSVYRGQSCNMHMTEALIAAFEATGEKRYLDRAESVAHRICVELAARAGGLVWEHYTKDWKIDWDYNKDDPKHHFRPYGYLSGHMTEWAKLLMILDRYNSRPWMLERARHFYKSALANSADLENGGMHFSFGPDGRLYDLDKYHWVLCETVAAAACLAERTGEARFWQDYDSLWAYSWKHQIDQYYGCWYRITTPDGRRYDDLKSPPGKTDYHPFGACYEILRVMGNLPGRAQR
ncbi:mannose-6-phosphate isomerase [Labrys miyagiensis]